MKRPRLGRLPAALFAVLILPAVVAAQDRGAIAGQVVDETAEPLAGVQVMILRTALSTVTNAQGRYLLTNVPTGTVEVRASTLGFGAASQSVAVSASDTTAVDFNLAPSALQLEEIVVTGTAGAIERRRQPAVISSINAAEQVAKGTSTSVTDLLTARVPGVQVTSSSGTSGTAQQIRIRGASSVTLSNEPLLFIDGVKVSSRTLTDIDIGGQGVSQLFDLNPEDIESIEIVKGPAAAALYGADASAGVIQVLTKRGQIGSGRYTQNISVEYNALDQTFTPPANFGACDEDAAAADSGVALCRGQPVGTIASDNPLERTGAFQTGYLRSVGYSGRGGGDNYGYYLSLGWDDEEATLPNNTLDRRSGRFNFTFSPRSNLRFDAGVSIGRTESTFPINDNNIYGYFGGGLLGRPTSVTESEQGEMEGGFYIPQRNLDAIGDIESRVRTLRFTPTVQVSYTPAPWFTNRLTLGADASRTEGMQFFPRNGLNWYGGDLNLGDLEEERINFDVYTIDYLGTFNTLFGADRQFSADLSVGAQAVAEVLDNVVGNGTDFVTNSNRVIGAAAQITADQDYQKTTQFGLLSQANLGFRDRLFLQFGARIDQFSSFGEDADPFFLPQVGVSYVISDESFWDPLASVLPTLRLHGAYGTTGRAPSAGASLETYEAQPYAVEPDVVGSGLVPDRPGNYDLRPEKGTEFEVGFDAGFFGQRLGLDVTYFHKRTTDLILEVPIPPSSGFATEPFQNIGEVLNRGWEVALRGTPVRTDNVQLDFSIAASTLHNELIDLGEVPAFGTMNRFEEGQPLGAFFTQRIRSVEMAEDTFAVVSNDLEFVGDLLPDFAGNFSTTLTLFGNVSISGLLDWKRGFMIYNNTAQFRDRAFGNSEIGVRGEELLGTEEYVRRFGPFFNEDGAEVAYTQVNEAYIQDGDFIRLRELSATFDLPQSIAGRFGATAASLTLGGRNLKLWSDYGGHDPEVLAQATRNTGVDTFEREDFLTVPQPRRWVAKLNLSF